MVISLAGISKRFRTWIFKDLSYRFESDIIYGIAGSNGSGKSTLLQIISGFMTPTTGELTYSRGSAKLLPDEFNCTISYAAPYVSLVEELTVREAIEFQNRCRSRSQQLSAEQVLIQAEMEGVQDRYLNQLSSGMMQRIKLALAIMSSSEVLLLDEPTSFLDEKSRQWFEKQLERHRKNRLVVIATNDPKDIGLCAEVLDVEQFSSA
ncbi:MAG: ABC transporter ATP-binding protein [Saprospiraceae bacterium]|nr:ABC transporter ATP-binding protein [Saprospiraceae bacterium]